MTRDPDPGNDKCVASRSLVIAVTGHRDIEPTNDLRADITEFFDELRQRYPSAPLVVVTALAEGADQIVADVAHQARLDVRVVLPMPRQTYLKYFDTDAGREEYERLEKLSNDNVLELPCDEDEAAALSSEAGRTRRYVILSRFLAAHSHILLALWDGQTGGPGGGTSYTVGLKTGAESAGEFRGPVECIPVVRGNRHSRGGPTLSRYALHPSGSGHPGEERSYWNAIFRDLERHNRALRSVSDEAVSKSLNSLVSPLPKNQPRRLRWIACMFARYDVLALALQRKIGIAYTGVVLSVIAAVLAHALFFDLDASADSERIPFVVAYYVAILLAFTFVHGAASWWQWESHQREYRALAEALRVRYFWEACGVIDARLRGYATRNAGPLWRALLESSLLPHSGTEPLNPSAALRFAIDKWVRPQEAYFAKSLKRSRSRHKAYTTIGRSAIVMAGMIPLLCIVRGGNPPNSAEIWSTVILLVGALAMWVTEKRAYAENVTRAEDMLREFSNSLERCNCLLSNPATEQHIRQELTDLGHRAMAENAEWLRLREERTLSVPTTA